MPPWHADPAYGDFVNDRRLNDADKATILKWATNGAPKATRRISRRCRPTPTAGRSPDAVFTLAEDYPCRRAPRSNTALEVPTNFTEDKWVQVFEVRPATGRWCTTSSFTRAPARPGATPTAATSSTGTPAPRRTPPFRFAPGMQEPRDEEVQAAKRAPANDRPAPKAGVGAFVGAFAPGQGVRIYEEGTAIRVPAGATLVFQMHYTANGKPSMDRSKIAMVFAKAPPKQEVVIAALMNGNFTLPAGSQTRAWTRR
jgi:hypothetical protein